MNQILRLLSDVHGALADVDGKIEEPASPDGQWWLDLRLGERHVAVVWDPRKAYLGATRMDGRGHGYGEKPEWASTNYYKALDHVLTLLGESE